MTQNADLYRLTKSDLIKRYQRLREEFDTLRMYLPDAMVEVTIDFEQPRLIYMNRMAYLMFGYSREDFMRGIPVADLFATRAEYQRIVEITREYVEDSVQNRAPYQRTGRQDLYEVRMRRKNGEVFEVEGQSSIVLDEEGIPVSVRTALRDISRRKALEEEREQLITNLRSTLEAVETLEGLLTICANCKKIRDDDGVWQELEVYIEAHSEAEFSHGICPDCIEKYYSDQ